MSSSQPHDNSSSLLSGARNTSARFRSCAECGEPIPSKRIAAMPSATVCVPCLQAKGDVPQLRRFDESTPSGDKVETIFTHDRQIEGAIKRAAHVAAPDSAFITDDEVLSNEDMQDILATKFIQANQPSFLALGALTGPDEEDLLDAVDRSKVVAIRRIMKGSPVAGDKAMIHYLEPETALQLGIHFQQAA